MQISIFGITGNVGSKLAGMALTEGYWIKAFVRNKAKYLAEHPNQDSKLEILEGSLEDQNLINKVCQGSNAIFSMMGGGLDENPIKASERINPILNAMKANSMNRILAIGGMGILQTSDTRMIKDTPNFPPEFKNVSEVHLKTFEALSHSDMNWTLICPPTILEKEPTYEFRTEINFPPPDPTQIGNNDLAFFMLKEAKENKFLKCRVGISY